jgi:hypothetical protein
VAALRSGRLPSLTGRRVAVVITGRTVDQQVLQRILA